MISISPVLAASTTAGGICLRRCRRYCRRDKAWSISIKNSGRCLPLTKSGDHSSEIEAVAQTMTIATSGKKDTGQMRQFTDQGQSIGGKSHETGPAIFDLHAGQFGEMVFHVMLESGFAHRG